MPGDDHRGGLERATGVAYTGKRDFDPGERYPIAATTSTALRRDRSAHTRSSLRVLRISFFWQPAYSSTSGGGNHTASFIKDQDGEERGLLRVLLLGGHRARRARDLLSAECEWDLGAADGATAMELRELRLREQAGRRSRQEQGSP